MSLDQKLRRIEAKTMERQESERLMPFKTLEERMIKYKRELDVKYREDLENELRRLKDFELSKMRIDEANKYRLKLQEYREDMEQQSQDRLRELKLREAEAWERIKNRERDVDKMAFEVRQKQLRDEEVYRARENECKTKFDAEMMVLKNDRNSLGKTMKDYELKMKEYERDRVKRDKDALEECERYKSELQRQMQD